MGHRPIKIEFGHEQEVEQIRYEMKSEEYLNFIKESYIYRQIHQLCKGNEDLKRMLNNLITGAHRSGYDLGVSGYCKRIKSNNYGNL